MASPSACRLRLCACPQQQIKKTFEALAREHGGHLRKEQAIELLKQGAANGNGNGRSEAAELLWAEMGLAEDAFITEVPLPDNALDQLASM